MEIIIRQARKNDAISLAQIAEQVFREEYSVNNLKSNIEMYCLENFSPEIQRQEILNSNIVTLVAEIDNILVGFAQLKITSSINLIEAKKPSELSRFYVLSTQHGSGLAQKIMKEVLRGASCESNDYIWLGVWENNQRAIRFYQKSGFSVVGEHVFKLGLDPQRDLIMSTKV